MFDRHRLSCLLFAFTAAAAGCSSKDNSGDTDHATKALHEAQTSLDQKQKSLASTETDIEKRKRELLKEQQELADREKALQDTKQALGSARGTLAEAHVAYQAAVASRLAKLDADIAELATKTDAKSKDAVVGLRARRNLLATKLSALPPEGDPTLDKYSKDVDKTFDAIETDLRTAMSWR